MDSMDVGLSFYDRMMTAALNYPLIIVITLNFGPGRQARWELKVCLQ